MLVNHTCQCWSITPVNAGQSHLSMLVNHTCQCWSITPVNAGQSHLSMLVNHTCQCWSITPVNVGQSHLSMLWSVTVNGCHTCHISLDVTYQWMLHMSMDVAHVNGCHVYQCMSHLSLLLIAGVLIISFPSSPSFILGLGEGTGELCGARQAVTSLPGISASVDKKINKYLSDIFAMIILQEVVVLNTDPCYIFCMAHENY